MVKEYFGIGTDVLDRYTKWHNLKRDVNAKIRLLYLECRRNLALLDCINTDKLNDEACLSDLLKLMLLFETDILEMIFMDGEKGNKLFDIFLKPIVAEKENEDDSEKKEMRTFVQAAMFIYVQASVLKKLGKPDIKASVLKKINYKVRISNLKKALSEIVKNLGDHNAVKQMLK